MERSMCGAIDMHDTTKLRNVKFNEWLRSSHCKRFPINW